MFVICFIVTIICVIHEGYCSAGNTYEWGYTGNHSPSNWHNHFPHCGGMRQSPIDIITANVVYNGKLGDIKLLGYNDTITKPPLLTNNGHSAQVNIEGNFFIEGGGLPSRYRVAQFHFHWGDADKRGSEHFINGQPFPLEMHIVHFSTEYPNITEAMNRPNGLAVISVFFEIGTEVHPSFQKVLSHFHSTIHRNDVTQLEPFSLRSLLPLDVKTFYRYSGSLTTPPCYESVIWSLYKDYVQISEAQLNVFRTLLKGNTSDGTNQNALVNDFRPIQPLNARLVETNTKSGTSTAPISLSQISDMLIFVSILVLQISL